MTTYHDTSGGERKRTIPPKIEENSKLSYRKRKWGARAILSSFYTCVLGGACFGLYEIPVHADIKGHHPKVLWPISSYHLLPLLAVGLAYVILILGILFFLFWALPALHKEAKW